VNKKRVKEGKLSANLILTRDAGSKLPVLFDINSKYGAKFACFVDMPVERGIARLAGMHMVDLVPASGDFKTDFSLRVNELLAVIPSFDCFYIHIKGPDEPGHDGDFQLKTRAIEAVDRYFFGKLLPDIDMDECLICITADHATPCKLKAHSDDPVPVLISGNKVSHDGSRRFSESECRNGGLGTLEMSTLLMPMLMKILRGNESVN